RTPISAVTATETMHRQPLAAVALILAACATVVPDIPRLVSFVLFAVVFVAVGVWALSDDVRLAFTARPGVFVGVLAVWLALLVGFVRSPTFGGLLRVGAFVVFTGAALFFIPSLIPRRVTYRMITIVASAFATLADRKSTRLNSSHVSNSYADFCLKKKKQCFIIH